MPLNLTFLQILLLGIFIHTTQAQTSYANDFVSPDYIVAGGFTNNTAAAQKTINDWATIFGKDGPWSVMNKSVTPPSGDKHDYMSWAPYWWPDCSGVGNTTVLPPEEVWKTCPYKSRDGQFNPDGRLVNDVGAFQSLSDAVLYNAIAWSTGGQASSVYSLNAVSYIRTWFLDDATRMNPNLNYSQMQRGPDGQTGSHTGILDLKGFTKITSGILIFRKGKCPDWTSDLDNQMVAWSQQYIQWLETASIAVEEGLAPNNHGTFYYNQLAALKILVNDIDGAKNVTNTYFNQQYMSQIEANGEQPLEAVRTRPYHYHAYNLAAMITNARLALYADPSSTVWNKTTSKGATIKTALDFAMNLSASTSNEASYADELYPNIAAVAATYGDQDGKYLAFLKNAEPNFMAEAYMLWNQPFALNEIPTSTSPSQPSVTKGNPGSKDSSSGGGNTNVNNNGSKSLSVGFAGWFCIQASIFVITSLGISFAF